MYKGLENNHAKLEPNRALCGQGGGENRFCQVGILSLFWDLTKFETLYLDAEKKYQKFGQEFYVWKSLEQSCRICAT